MKQKMSKENNVASSLTKLEADLTRIQASAVRSPSADRRLGDIYRAVLRTYQDAVSGRSAVTSRLSDDEKSRLTNFAREAFLYLGGQSDPSPISLKDYDHRKYGPYLGVSDEGSAAQAIRDAAMKSPKIKVFGKITPLVVGVSLDAERLGAIGETPVGPEEYADIFLQCTGRLLTSTNVGTRLNLRFYKSYPVVIVRKGPVEYALIGAKKELKAIFQPFLQTPDKKPRPLRVYVEFDRESRRSTAERVYILRELASFISGSEIADHSLHRLGFQMRIGFGKKGMNAALLAIDIASSAGLESVSIDGVVHKEAEEKVSLPGLLNYLAPGLVGPILRKASEKGVCIHPKNLVDTETVARNVWSSLNTARHMGLWLGKYGTFPLTFEETDEVIGKIQSWFKDWTAAPVFFVDQGIISSRKVFVQHDVVSGIKEWLRIVKQHKAPVVLIDTLDKSKGYRILRSKTEPKGLLGLFQIKKIDELAASWGIRVLWAGGITLPQVYEFGKMGVFGIYVTTAVSSSSPVSKVYEKDPMLASMKEPTFDGVFRTKLLLEAGFLVARRKCARLRESIDNLAKQTIQKIMENSSSEEIEPLQTKLYDEVVSAWKLSKST